METGLGGKSVLVTGASGRLGSACARAFDSEGCSLILHCHHGRAEAERLAVSLSSATVVSCDLVDGYATERLFDKVGNVDICVAVTGYWPPDDVPLWELSLDRWNQTVAVNLTTAFNTARCFLRTVSRRRSGNLIFVGSMAGVLGEAGHADYAAAKAAILWGLLPSLKNEIVRAAPTGRVNAVAPGWTVSPVEERSIDEEAILSVTRTCALRQLARPEDVAAQVVVLASDKLSGHVTGEIIQVAGGQEGRIIHRNS
jgi:3-oxoacyl-[acyl-carrier protein] reductase